jgi:hypothetical protein
MTSIRAQRERQVTLRAVALVVVAVTTVGLASAPLLACEGDTRVVFNEAATLQGTLKTGKGEHEAQGPFEYVYVELDKPICVDAPPATPGDEDAPQSVSEPVSRVQIAGEASNQQLPIGKHVAVEGTLFPAHTMWHVEQVLIDAPGVEVK